MGMGSRKAQFRSRKQDLQYYHNPVMQLRRIQRQLRKVKSDSNESKKSEGNSELKKVKSESSDGNVKNSLQLQLVKAKTSVAKKPNDKIDSEGSSEGTEKNPVGIDQDCTDLVVCEEKAITSISSNVKTPSDDDFVDGEEEEEWDEEEEQIDEENDIKEITVQESNLKKLQAVPLSPIVKKLAPTSVNHAMKIHTSPTKTKPIPVSDDFQRTPRPHSKLQSFVDLVMWRDVSKSSFIFGIGTFVILSSSYTKDLNISFISVVSYLGLVYLAAIFLFRSLISRGEIDTSEDYVVGEEDAIWLLKLILPYINEFLLKIRALFSGDPATTMKLAVLLFVLARCGSSITIWKMAKLGFFGVFIVPKVCSSYSAQLTAYGTFWIRRFRDAWESCSHKKAVGFAIFTLVWNLSSMVARIWAVFVLFVGLQILSALFDE
ncbi:Reticulon-like protein B21 [Abeliophyllum distichum]|uniref:Reticulon-like protein n=1 Tax=Abeliophyllum distichum TaxID=126358 RepID=A0ABD1QY69_9LAMI